MKGKALLAGCIALAFSNMALAEDIKVAVVGAMSGPVAQYGDQEFTGAEQAVADINAKGGIKGNKLQIVKYDDACDPKQAVAVANKVVNDGIKYVIGHLCSSSTQPASDIYEDEGILMITPAATAPELTARGYQLILRTTGLDSDQGPTAAKYILEKVKPQRIAIVHDKQQYGEGLARAVQDGLKKGNANVVFFDGITAGEKDFSTLVARLKKENIDFVYYGGYHPEMGQILRQARAAGLKTQFMGPEGVANVSLSNIAGESAEGLLVTKPKNYDQVPANKPIVGNSVFTQVAGVHADGDNKNNLYCNDLLPERFGRVREYALGKTSGKANIRKNLEQLGLELDDESMKKVTDRIIELGDRKELVTQEDLPYIISDVLKHDVTNARVRLLSYFVTLAQGLKPMATLSIDINGRVFQESSSGDGQYDAFVRALRKIYKGTLGRTFPMLVNYAVTIPPGGRTDAFVHTVITWSYQGREFRTRGLDADQTEAAIKATMKMLNMIEEGYADPVPAE